MREVARDHASVDWPTFPLRSPSGDGPSADPVQKQVPGKWITQKGIDQPRPVTEARMSEAKYGTIIDQPSR